MNPLYPSVFKYDLKVAGTETRPFLSILFSKLDKNIFFKKAVKSKIVKPKVIWLDGENNTPVGVITTK